MKLQLAIDRVSIEKAIKIIKNTGDYVDIIEIGTSLIKDYGMESIRKIKEEFPYKTILADIKTIDEAEYEFHAAFKAGADIATVMGGAAISSIKLCQRAATEYGRSYVIDLLEVNDAKLEQLKQFTDAIFCIHLPADNEGLGLDKLIEDSAFKLKTMTHLAAAGGVSKESIPILIKNKIEIAIIGGAITKAEDSRAAAKDFYEICK